MSDTKKISTNHQIAATFLGLVVIAALATLALPAPADAEIRFHYDADAQQPINLEEPFERKAPKPRYSFMVPHYIVDTTSAAGMTTLYSVRNRSIETYTVELAYFDDQGLEVRVDEVLLGSKETVTLNLRNIAGLPVGPDGIARGTVLITLLDDSGSIEPTNVLTGDFFYVDPTEDFASGGVLIDTLSSNCTRWDSRYFAGGPFTGGTDFLYLLPNGPDNAGLIAEGNVYDESGVFQGIVSISSDGEITGVANSSDSPELPPFGTIEWRFTNDNMGSMMAIFSAEGRYSVGTRSFCAD